MNINRLQKNKKAGFSILEVIVAIFILLISISGPLVFSQNGLKSSFIGRDQIIAFYLAQDAIEFVKNTRENNLMDNNSWLNGLSGCFNVAGCRIDTINEIVEDCKVVNCSQNLNIDNDYQYTYDSGTSSRFSRRVKIDELAVDKEARIDVTVIWTGSYAEQGKSVKVSEYIYNWYAGITQ